MPISFAQLVMILNSPAAQKIDFWIRGIHVDGNGLREVATQVFVKVAGFKGIAIKFEPQDPGVGASYHNDKNYYSFPTDPNFGSVAVDRMHIVHESVHALQDLGGARWFSTRGTAANKFVDNEAAAYVAGALYSLYDTGIVYGGSPFDDAFIIAKSIVNRKGAVVSDAVAQSLTTAISINPVYTSLGVTTTTPNPADGI